MHIKKALIRWLPPVVADALRRLFGLRLRFSGRYGSWAEARARSSGYDDDLIFERVADATRKVLRGEAAYERDSITFDELELPFPLLAALLRAARTENRGLHVIDYGGALGTTYRQCKSFLDRLPSLHWHVVEQARFVQLGKQEFAHHQLAFAESIAAVPWQEGARLGLLSNVLQYLERPMDVVRELESHGVQHLVILTVPLSAQAEHTLCNQIVPASIYRASYPCWIFSRSRFLDEVGAQWRIVADLPADEGTRATDEGLSFKFCGLILERRGAVA